MSYLTARELFTLKKNIVRYDLDTSKDYHTISDKELLMNYNGVGADDTPIIIRSWLTKVFSLVLEAVFLHDQDYTQKQENKKLVDQRMYDNMRKLIEIRCTNWWQKSWYMFKIKAAHDAVLTYGKQWIR